MVAVSSETTDLVKGTSYALRPMTKFHRVVGDVELRRVISAHNGRLSMRASMLSWFVLSAAGWVIVFGLLLFFGLIG